MVASGDDVATILPSWIISPYMQTYDLASVQIDKTPQARTWYCATRHGAQPDNVEAFVSVLVSHVSSPV